ncbi:MAG TPA: histidine phosphatase family protein [Gemmatimonadales bacterium]|nr:histidine phosphatase family protein [Gemmatimonadales bacterium]
MQLLVIRHAIAEDRDTFATTGQADTERPLTPRGRRRMRAAVRGLRTVIRGIDLLASSPLVRARQTADIVATGYRRTERVEVPALAPAAAPQEFVDWLTQQAAREVVAAVGHEPALSALVSWLATGRTDPVIIELKKGAVCLLEFPGPVAAGAGVITWAMAPGQLRRLGR